MAFVMYRSETDRRKDKQSNFTEFNKFLHNDNAKTATIVGHAPILNVKSDSHNTIYTVWERGRFIVNCRGQDDAWFTVDQGIHGPAMEVKFTLGDEWNKVHFRMGGLHWSTT